MCKGKKKKNLFYYLILINLVLLLWEKVDVFANINRLPWHHINMVLMLIYLIQSHGNFLTSFFEEKRKMVLEGFSIELISSLFCWVSKREFEERVMKKLMRIYSKYDSVITNNYTDFHTFWWLKIFSETSEEFF